MSNEIKASEFTTFFKNIMDEYERKLEGNPEFSASAKILLINAIRDITGFRIKESIEFVDIIINGIFRIRETVYTVTWGELDLIIAIVKTEEEAIKLAQKKAISVAKDLNHCDCQITDGKWVFDHPSASNISVKGFVVGVEDSEFAVNCVVVSEKGD